ncbi:MAG: hypothetical protein GOMPHAMPRED_001608 [Gomphillus americanus]|uniref:D-isomer specific 2-hydroxyacid dehydrogenase NAD-binding domain-containing protein n=1 Tax=Gomphillus americanus TaxID=1940652 RepID=A0A8H3I8E1_9LECA|nr:MAG: hypothetical protein GOMPHAMPRED_001608 [Gomphillus americanus]
MSTLPSDPSDLPNVQFIHLTSAGSDHLVNHPIYTSSKIPLTTSSGIHGPTISEWVIMTILSHAHRFPLLLSWKASSHWPAGRDIATALSGVHDYAGQTIGILGYGSIGRQVAHVASALGMRVLAYTATPRSIPESKHDNGFILPGTGDAKGTIPSAWFSGLAKKDLHNFLSQDIDILVISVPLTKQTTHFLSEAEFAVLGRKSGRKPLVINIARGKIIVQSALISALELFRDQNGEQGLRGAALDVADPEPLPDGDPLWSAPNLFLSPHCSGHSDDYSERSALLLEGNLERWRRGETLWNLIDRERGY